MLLPKPIQCCLNFVKSFPMTYRPTIVVDLVFHHLASVTIINLNGIHNLQT